MKIEYSHHCMKMKENDGLDFYMRGNYDLSDGYWMLVEGNVTKRYTDKNCPYCKIDLMSWLLQFQ